MATIPKLLVMTALLAGCETAPPTLERMDENTGVTVQQMGRPLEFQSPDPQGPDSLWYAYFGALEVNRMGSRKHYVWLSVMPGGLQARRPGSSAKIRLTVVAGSRAIEPEYSAATPVEIGLSRTPYRRPAEWARDGYFTVAVEQLRAMKAASKLTLQIDDGSGERTYQLFDPDLSSLHAFVEALEP